MRLITENSIISEQGDLNTEGRDWWSHRGLNVLKRGCKYRYLTQNRYLSKTIETSIVWGLLLVTACYT